MAQTTTTTTQHLGFLTILHDANGYSGGYLVTNHWGRPLEFRLSTAVQPNRVQQILYGGTLQPYVCADLIGKTLVEKAGIAIQLLVTDSEAALDLRLRLDVPVVWLAAGDALVPAVMARGVCVRPGRNGRGPVFCHPRHADDVGPVGELLGRLESNVDLAEPFQRIRDAMSEARRMGVGNRN